MRGKFGWGHVACDNCDGVGVVVAHIKHLAERGARPLSGFFHAEVVKHNQRRRPQFVKQVKFLAIAVERRLDVVKQTRHLYEQDGLACPHELLCDYRRQKRFAGTAFAVEVRAEVKLLDIFGKLDCGAIKPVNAVVVERLAQIAGRNS